MSMYGDDAKGNVKNWLHDEMVAFILGNSAGELLEMVANAVKEAEEKKENTIVLAADAISVGGMMTEEPGGTVDGTE